MMVTAREKRGRIEGEGRNKERKKGQGKMLQTERERIIFYKTVKENREWQKAWHR